MLEFLRNLLDPLFSALGWLLSTFHNDLGAPWWLSIVMLTIIVRTVLLPLTFRSTKNMRAMQALKPDMDALKEKYKGDQQKIQQETMKLYQERQVSPLGGCLPMVIQLPIFLVLYYTIREFDKLESFRTGGLFWFPDLTAADPYFILPVLYVATMMASQEVTLRNSPMQGQQQMIMRFLPIVFGFFLARFPSALLIYWITSNTISFTQNLVIYRLYPMVSHADEKSPAKPAANGKKETSALGVSANGKANGKVNGKANGKVKTQNGNSGGASASNKRRRKKKSRKK